MKTIEQFRVSLRGSCIKPDDAAYDAARKVYNASIDRRPALIVKCADANDVALSVRFARERAMLVAVRGGGHSGAGFGTCDGGIVIDLGAMRGVTVDGAAREVRVEGGATWSDVDQATHAHGLTVPCGVISTTGVAGLTLGGGHGHLTRKYGLTIDSLLGAELVLADGSSVTANARENQELFWAIRGGGGNFGIATVLHLRAHPVRTVIGGPMIWPLEVAPQLMRFYMDELAAAPEDIGGFFATMIIPPGPPFPEPLHMTKCCGIVWCCTGEPAEAARVLDRFRRFRAPAVDFTAPLSMPALNSMFDAQYPSGLQWHWKGDVFADVSDAAIGLHVKYSERLPTMLSTMHLYPIDGAAARVPEGDTAWAHRSARFSEVILGVDPDPANASMLRSWARDYWMALHPHSLGGAYSNFMMGDEGAERVRATYGRNHGRLLELKREFDPMNFFRVNHNIDPGAT